jgi:hypothetical protein
LCLSRNLGKRCLSRVILRHSEIYSRYVNAELIQKHGLLNVITKGGFMARSRSGLSRRRTQIRHRQKRREKRRKLAQRLGVTIEELLAR